MIKFILRKTDNLIMYNKIYDNVLGVENYNKFTPNSLLNDNIVRAISSSNYIHNVSDEYFELDIDIDRIVLFNGVGVFIKDYPIIQNKLNKLIQYCNINNGINIAQNLIYKYIDNGVINYVNITQVCDNLDFIIKVCNKNILITNSNIDKLELILDELAPPDEEYLYNKDGKLIVIEGCDCIGKDYILKYVGLYGDPRCYFTREPGGTKLAEDIRNILLDNNTIDLCTKAEALLYSASRAQHIEEVITPQLQAGLLVISNRFYYSTLIYQKYRGVNIEELSRITKATIGECIPNVVISLYDKDFKVVGERIKNKKNKDRLELSGLEMFKNINNDYSTLDNIQAIKDIDNGKSKIYTVDISKGNAINEVRNILLDEL